MGVGASALAAPAWATTGGASVGGGSSGSPSGGPSGLVESANVTVTASGNGVTISTRASATLHGSLRFTGRIPSADAGSTVEIERLGNQTGWVWAATVHARARSDGSFSATWRTNHIGRFEIRAVVAQAASPPLTTTVYRQTIATLYGPGFWGSRTACGEVLRRGTLGVANRTLPCGTPVAIYYQGRTIVVPVIDRGPYANHADYDLTMATGSSLGMTQTETIGAVSLPGRS
jgi:peptidoglycan lytic transglycosylase